MPKFVKIGNRAVNLECVQAIILGVLTDKSGEELLYIDIWFADEYRLRILKQTEEDVYNELKDFVTLCDKIHESGAI